MRQILSIAVLLSALVCQGASIYVANTAQGGDTGADAANAHAISWLNNAANWGVGAGKVNSGDTVHLVGTFTGAANSVILTVPASGSAGSPVTILFDSGASMQAPYFKGSTGSGGAIVINAKNYLTIDGGSNGFIACTNNGSALAFQQSAAGVYVTGSTGVTIRNLTITNIYVNGGSSTNSVDTGGQSTDCIRLDGNNSSCRIYGNRLYAARSGVDIGFEGAAIDNIEIDHNTIADHCWGIAMGNGSAGATSTNVRIHDNEITDWTNWQYPGGSFPPDTYHTDGIILFTSAGSGPFRPQIYNNYIHGDLGGGSPTAFIFITYGTTSADHAATIYNNVLYVTPGGSGVGVWIQENTTNTVIYNNTIYGSGKFGGVGIFPVGTSATIRNNILIRWSHAIGTQYSYVTNSVAASDNNVIYGIIDQPFYDLSGFMTLVQWQAKGFDLNSRFTNPLLDPVFVPQGGSSAIGVGANLSAVFTTDKAGQARPTVGAWDAGAYIYGTSPPRYLSIIGTTRTGKASL